MSTTETVRAWATTNAGNASADAAITSSDAQSPDTIDNNIRSVMAAVKKQMNDIGGSLVAGGTANALTVTTGQVLESGQITDGLRILLKATADNTSATVTFAPDGLTPANIKRADGSALAVGSIKAGMYLDLVYNAGSSEWRCANIAPAQFGSEKASFRAYKGSSQTISGGSITTVTWSNEVFDQGSCFASNAWTPPAGTAYIFSKVDVSGIAAGTSWNLTLYKDGVQTAQIAGVSDSTGAGVLQISLIDQCNGSNAYTVAVQSPDTSFTVSFTSATGPIFMGTMI